jgi:purine nucleoside phosphorylase
VRAHGWVRRRGKPDSLSTCHSQPVDYQAEKPLTDPPGFVVRQDREHPYFPRLRISRAEAHDPGVVRTHPSLCPSTR